MTTNIVAQHDAHLLTHCFCGQDSSTAQLTPYFGWVPTKLSSRHWPRLWSYLKAQPGKTPLLSSWGCWQDLVLCHLLGWGPRFLAGGWLEAVLGPLLHQSQWGDKVSHATLVKKSWPWWLTAHLLVRSKSQVLPTLRGRGIRQGHEYQEVGPLGNTVKSPPVVNLYEWRSGSQKALHQKCLITTDDFSLQSPNLSSYLQLPRVFLHHFPPLLCSCSSPYFLFVWLYPMMSDCIERLIPLFPHLCPHL